MHRKLSKKSLSNYKPVFEAKDKGRWKPVYEKRFAVDRPKLYSRKFKNRQFKAEREKAVTGTPERASLVEVKGLVSAFAVSDGIARRKNSPFSAEMLFTWWGNRDFDERRLLSSAWEILLDSLADMDRINMPLISSLTMDEGRGGIESVNEVRVESEQFNEMEYTVFIPNIKGRAYFKGSAKVVL